MAVVEDHRQFEEGFDFLYRMPERRSCCGRFCEIMYIFLSNLCIAIIDIFFRIFDSERPQEQDPAPADPNQGALQQQVHHRVKDFSPSAHVFSVTDYLNNVLSILSKPSISVDDLSEAERLIVIAIELQQNDEKAWKIQLTTARTNLVQRLHTLAQKKKRTDIRAFIESSSAVNDPLDFSHTAEEHLSNALAIVQNSNASIDELLGANRLLATACGLQQKREKAFIEKLQETRGNISYKRYLLDPQKQAADLDLAINSFKLVRESSDSGLALQTLAQLLFIRWQLNRQKGDLDESIAIYQDAIAKLPSDNLPQAHLELGDAYTLRRKGTHDLSRACEEYVAALQLTIPQSKLREQIEEALKKAQDLLPSLEGDGDPDALSVLEKPPGVVIPK